jgi:hypothetical protein
VKTALRRQRIFSKAGLVPHATSENISFKCETAEKITSSSWCCMNEVPAMRRAGRAILWMMVLGFALGTYVSAQTASGGGTAITVPVGTTVPLVVTRAVWAKRAQVGDSLYTETTFPVTAGDGIAIPQGSFVTGQIVSLTKPTRKAQQARLQVKFTGLVLPGDYSIALPDVDAMDVTVRVSTANDLLLDKGAQMDLVLGQEIALDRSRVAASLKMVRRWTLPKFASATACRETAGTPGSPGTPGTPDTVLPGSPGTPDTVIPGSNGTPDTVMPGIPASPPTVIPGNPGSPGDPGTPGTSCPSAPLVVTSVPVNTVGVGPPPATQPVNNKP